MHTVIKKVPTTQYAQNSTEIDRIPDKEDEY